MTWKEITRRRAEEVRFRCENCRRRAPIHGHHFLPRSRGGRDDYDNAIVLCQECHRSAHEYRGGFEFMVYRKFYYRGEPADRVLRELRKSGKLPG